MSRIPRRAFFLLFLLVLQPVLGGARAAGADAQLLHVRESVWRAWFAGDTGLLEKLVPPDTVVISAGDKRWKRQADVLKEAAAFHASGARLTRLEFPKTIVQHFGNVAIVWSDYVVEIESAGKRSTSSGRATEIFVLHAGTWLNPGWHTDRNP
jgi:ketosteroid isomerase-like protein